MNKSEKLLSKLESANNTFVWSDLVTLLARLGYDMQEMAGSRVRFYNADTGHMMRLHKPHPESYIKGGALKDVRTAYCVKAGGLFVTYLKYKGYLGTIEPDIESGTLYGKLAFIRDLVTYEAIDLTALEHEFRASVDGYLEDCKELGKAADTPCKGSFNVRVGHDLHMAAIVVASRENISLNDLARRALSEYIMNHAGQ